MANALDTSDVTALNKNFYICHIRYMYFIYMFYIEYPHSASQ